MREALVSMWSKRGYYLGLNHDWPEISEQGVSSNPRSLRGPWCSRVRAGGLFKMRLQQSHLEPPPESCWAHQPPPTPAGICALVWSEHFQEETLPVGVCVRGSLS